MRQLCINSLAMSVFLATTSCTFHGQEEGSSSASSSSSSSSSSSGGGNGSSAGSGGAFSGYPCVWAESRPDLTFPVCPEDRTAEFMGTIDGKPYDLRYSGEFTAMGGAPHPPYSLGLGLPGFGHLSLEWGDPFISGQWAHITSGVLVLPEDLKERAVHDDSELLFDCDEYSFLHILHVDGGDLTACSR